MLEVLGRLDFAGGLAAPDDLSGVALAGDFLLLGSDEGHRLQILKRLGPDGYRVTGRTVTLARKGREVDIEAICFAGGMAYATGSHARRRRSIDPVHRSVAQNRKRYLRIDRQKARGRLVRFPFDPVTGTPGKVERIGLTGLLRKDPLLGPFTRLPSKENGVDIEALACCDGRLYLGLRGPVLRHNLVPVLVLTFDRPKDYELRLVQLDGAGIRDLTAVAGGFLILSGPVNDAAAPYALWFWDGSDQLPGRDRVGRPAHCLGEVPAGPGCKAEGLALVAESDDAWEVLIVYDAVRAGSPTRFRVSKPRQ